MTRGPGRPVLHTIRRTSIGSLGKRVKVPSVPVSVSVSLWCAVADEPPGAFGVLEVPRAVSFASAFIRGKSVTKKLVSLFQVEDRG